MMVSRFIYGMLFAGYLTKWREIGTKVLGRCFSVSLRSMRTACSACSKCRMGWPEETSVCTGPNSCPFCKALLKSYRKSTEEECFAFLFHLCADVKAINIAQKVWLVLRYWTYSQWTAGLLGCRHGDERMKLSWEHSWSGGEQGAPPSKCWAQRKNRHSAFAGNLFE